MIPVVFNAATSKTFHFLTVCWKVTIEFIRMVDIFILRSTKKRNQTAHTFHTTTRTVCDHDNVPAR